MSVGSHASQPLKYEPSRVISQIEGGRTARCFLACSARRKRWLFGFAFRSHNGRSIWCCPVCSSRTCNNSQATESLTRGINNNGHGGS